MYDPAPERELLNGHLRTALALATVYICCGEGLEANEQNLTRIYARELDKLRDAMLAEGVRHTLDDLARQKAHAFGPTIADEDLPAQAVEQIGEVLADLDQAERRTIQ